MHVNTMEGCWSLLPSRLRGNRTFRTMLIENKYAIIAAVVAFLLVLRLTGGSMFAALGALGLIAGVGWAARRLLRHRQHP